MEYPEYTLYSIELAGLISETDENIYLKYTHNNCNHGLVIRKNQPISVDGVQAILNFYKDYIKNNPQELE